MIEFTEDVQALPFGGIEEVLERELYQVRSDAFRHVSGWGSPTVSAVGHSLGGFVTLELVVSGASTTGDGLVLSVDGALAPTLGCALPGVIVAGWSPVAHVWMHLTPDGQGRIYTGGTTSPTSGPGTTRSLVVCGSYRARRLVGGT